MVVAILAGLSVAGYSTIQANARDAQIKSASQKIAEAIELWSLTSRNLPSTGGLGTTVAPTAPHLLPVVTPAG